MKKKQLRFVVASEGDIHKIEKIEQEIQTMGHYLGGACGCRGYLLPEFIKVTIIDERVIHIAFFEAQTSDVLPEVIEMLEKFSCKQVAE